MKKAFAALVLTLVSSSAFATGPLPPCELSILEQGSRITRDAQSFVSDVEQMEQMQIQQEGRSMLSGDTLGRAQRARDIIAMVDAVRTSLDWDYELSNALCEVKLDVNALLAK